MPDNKLNPITKATETSPGVFSTASFDLLDHVDVRQQILVFKFKDTININNSFWDNIDILDPFATPTPEWTYNDIAKTVTVTATPVSTGIWHCIRRNEQVDRYVTWAPGSSVISSRSHNLTDSHIHSQAGDVFGLLNNYMLFKYAVGQPNGIPNLDGSGTIPIGQIPDHTHSLSEITQSGASVGEIPKWDGVAWVPSPDGGSGGGDGIWGAITGTLSDQTDLQSALDGKSNVGHTHTLSNITDAGTLAGLNNINNTNWSGTDLAIVNGGTGASDAASARTNLGAAATVHTHVIADTTGLQTALDSKAPTVHTHTLSQITDAGTLAGLNTINNSNWSGTDLAVVNGGTGASDAAAARTNLGAAAASHTHPLSDLTQSGAVSGQVAKWNGSAWAPSDESGGSTGPKIQTFLITVVGNVNQVSVPNIDFRVGLVHLTYLGQTVTGTVNVTVPAPNANNAVTNRWSGVCANGVTEYRWEVDRSSYTGVCELTIRLRDFVLSDAPPPNNYWVSGTTGGLVVFQDTHEILVTCIEDAPVLAGGSGSGVEDGDKGDITVSGAGTSWVVNAGVIDTTKMGGTVTTGGKALLQVSAAADRIPYFNGLSTATTTAITALARTLLGNDTTSAARTTLDAAQYIPLSQGHIAGRHSVGAGPIESVLVGDGLTIDATSLRVSSTLTAQIDQIADDLAAIDGIFGGTW